MRVGEEGNGKYTKFWNEFGKLLKLGIIEDTSNRQRLAKLMRFHTSKSTDKLVSLEQYIERMKPSQKKIYYFIGEPCCEHLLSNSWDQGNFANFSSLQPGSKYIMITSNKAEITHDSPYIFCVLHVTPIEYKRSGVLYIPSSPSSLSYGHFLPQSAE